MKKIKKKWFQGIMVITIMLFLVACGSESTSSPNNSGEGQNKQEANGDQEQNQSKEPIKLGMVAPMSGPYAVMGKANLNAIEFAIEEANNAGGVLGRKVEVVVEDSEAKPNVLLTKAEKLALNEKINLFIGTVSSGESMALAGKLKEWNSLYVSTSSKNTKLTNPVNPNLFRANYNDDVDMRIWKYWLQNSDEGKKAKTFYSVGADYAWGHDQTKNFKDIISKDIPGGKFLGEAFYPLGTTDYSAQLTQIASLKPDVTLVLLAGDDFINFMKQAKDFGVFGKTKFLAIVGKTVIDNSNAIGVAGSLMYDYSIDNPMNAEFVKSYKIKYGTEPDDWAGYSYIGAKMLLKAIENAGSTETDKVIQALENVEFDSIVGNVKMNPKTHELIIPGYIGESVEDPNTGKATIKIIETLKPDDIWSK
ncbi:branched-chain amino acid transport system substrate-binding protein [Neobacillus sp. B4I6]|uniref:ABC transporter substrate-binding protein n=1 Tax=Neobacillus sp. B4I6 TaxID=3373925 RepID=UPI003D199F1F